MTEWQPIETAPKDGTWILVLCPEGESKAEPFIQVARWMEFEVSREKDWAWGPLDDYFGSYRWYLPSSPTHWMPLPEPPQK